MGPVVCSQHGGCNPGVCFDLHHGNRTLVIRKVTVPWLTWLADLTRG